LIWDKDGLWIDPQVVFLGFSVWENVQSFDEGDLPIAPRSSSTNNG
jgi:hypothetical protein